VRTLMTDTMILTGAASGIGKRMAHTLYERGHRLVLCDVNEPGLRAAAEELRWTDTTRVSLERLDVRDASAWDALVARTVERFGRLDVLMNIAGFLVPAWAKDATQADVDRTIDINVKGLIFGTNTAIRTMIAQRSGHIVNIASIAGLVPVPGIAIYSASKHAARAYSIAVAQEVRQYGVYVTAVCPTVVATPMMDIQVDKEQAAYTFSGGRPLRPEEVVEAVIERALVKKPLELVLPSPGTQQGRFAKLANVFPELGLRVARRVSQVGQMNQQKIRKA
jgi:3-oxoacyl-[acyl-carrier protein] reductase